MKNEATLLFKGLLDDLKIKYVMEYTFDTQFNRRFRFDFAVLHRKVGFEIDGATWTNGRHTRGKGFSQDCLKQFIAHSQGWTVYRIPTCWFSHHKRKKYQPHLMYYEDLRELVKKIGS